MGFMVIRHHAAVPHHNVTKLLQHSRFKIRANNSWDEMTGNRKIPLTASQRRQESANDIWWTLNRMDKMTAIHLRIRRRKIQSSWWKKELRRRYPGPWLPEEGKITIMIGLWYGIDLPLLHWKGVSILTRNEDASPVKTCKLRSTKNEKKTKQNKTKQINYYSVMWSASYLPM